MIKNNYFKLCFYSLMLFSLSVFLSACGTSQEKFVKPDIKDDFCAVVINYQYCKCAFHNEFCDVVGLNSATANWYVRSEYNRYIEFLQEEFSSSCRRDGGKILSRNTCTYCEAPREWEGNKCVEKKDEEENEEENRDDFHVDGPFNPDCSIDETTFNSEWEKYSDLEGPMEFTSRSWESQQALGIMDKIAALKTANFELERDMEIDRQIRLDLRDYREKLVQNQKSNLIKALIRMTYLTYTTVDAAKGAAGSYKTFLESTSVIARAGGLISSVRTFVPTDASIAIDTSTNLGKAVNVGFSTAVEAMEKLGNPKDIAVKFITESRNAALPSVDLSPEEIEILRSQHLKKAGIDAALASSYKINAERRAALQENQNKINQMEADFAVWKEKEKSRIKYMLEEDCLKRKNEYDKK